MKTILLGVEFSLASRAPLTEGIMCAWCFWLYWALWYLMISFWYSSIFKHYGVLLSEGCGIMAPHSQKGVMHACFLAYNDNNHYLCSNNKYLLSDVLKWQHARRIFDNSKILYFFLEILDWHHARYPFVKKIISYF